jgi:hypothetical protein
LRLSDTVWAGPGAVFATNTLVVIDQYYAIFLTLVGCPGRTYWDAGRIFTVQTGFWEMYGLGIGINTGFIGLHAIKESTRRICIIRILIHQRPGRTGGIPLLARRHAGMAADANVEVDDEG